MSLKAERVLMDTLGRKGCPKCGSCYWDSWVVSGPTECHACGFTWIITATKDVKKEGSI